MALSKADRTDCLIPEPYEMVSPSHTYVTSSWRWLSPGSWISSGWCLCPIHMNLSRPLHAISGNVKAEPCVSLHRWGWAWVLLHQSSILLFRYSSPALFAKDWGQHAHRPLWILLFCFFPLEKDRVISCFQVWAKLTKKEKKSSVNREMLRDCKWMDGKAFFSNVIAQLFWQNPSCRVG